MVAENLPAVAGGGRRDHPSAVVADRGPGKIEPGQLDPAIATSRIRDGEDCARRPDLQARVGEEDLEHPAVRLESRFAHEPADPLGPAVGAQRQALARGGRKGEATVGGPHGALGRLDHALRIVGHSPAVREVIEFFNMVAFFGDPLVIPANEQS